MKVALLLYAKDSFGGAERRLLRVYNELAKEGVICDIIVYGCNEDKIETILQKADCDCTYFNSLFVFEKKIKCLVFLMRNSLYDIIHIIDTSNFNIIIAYLCKLKNTKVIYSICSYFIAKSLTSASIKKKTKKLLRMVNHVDLLYPSSYEFICGVAGNKVTVTPGTFTNLEIFKPKEKEKLIVFAAARLETSKNPMLAILAAEKAKELIIKQGYRVKLLGKGYEEDTLNRYITEHDLSDIVEITGYVRTSEVLPQAAVFLSLQQIENYPSQSLAEAVGSGCYVIVTDVGDSRKCATHDFAEFVSLDVDSLSNAIESYILKTEEEKESIIKKARLYANGNYSIDASKDYFKNLLLG